MSGSKEQERVSAITQAVEAARERIIALHRSYVQVRSVTGDEGAMGARVAETFRERGLATATWAATAQEMPPSLAPPAPPRPRRALWPWLLALALLGGLFYAGFLLWPRPPEKVVELPPPPPPEAPSRYTLRVQSDPPGARVYLDGFYLGQTPLETPPLEGGERVLRLERPGYAPLERRILLDRNLSLSLALTPEKPPPQEAAEEAPANKLVLKVEGRSWLRVTRGGERLYEGIPEVGSELVFDLPVEVRSGNPGAVRVILGGKDLGPMGEPGIPVTRRYP